MIDYTLEGWQLKQATVDGLTNFKRAERHRRLHGRARPGRPRSRSRPTAARRGSSTSARGSSSRTARPSSRATSSTRSSASSRCTARPRRASTACSSAPTSASRPPPPARSRAASPPTTRRGRSRSTSPAPTASGCRSSRSRSRASCLPGTPNKDQGPKPIPSTGSYVMKSYDPNHMITLVRNPYFKEWSKDAQPKGYPDVITERFDLTGEAEVTQVENGQADWIGYSIPTDRLNELGDQVPEPAAPEPADGELVRADERQPRAVQQRRRAARGQLCGRPRRGDPLFGGSNLARPSCQILPKGFPGHVRLLPVHEEPRRPVDGARHGRRRSPLAKKSGTQGQKVAVVAPNNAVDKAVGDLPAEPAQQARLEGVGEDPVLEHPVQLHPEHEEQGADQRHAVVPGLPGRGRLPERAASAAARSIRAATRASTSPASATRRSRSRWTRRSTHGVNPTAGNKLWAKVDQRGHRPGAGRRRSSTRRTSTSCRSGSATSRSAASTTSSSTRPGCSDDRPPGSTGGRRPRQEPGAEPLGSRLAPPAAEPHRAGLVRALLRDRGRLPGGAALRPRRRAHRPVHVERLRHHDRPRQDGAGAAAEDGGALGIGETPIGPTWDLRPLLPRRRRPGPRRRRTAALRRPQLAPDRRRLRADLLRARPAHRRSSPASSAAPSTTCSHACWT